MTLDPVKNFARVEVSQGYDGAATSIDLVSGDGAKLPDPSVDGEFNIIWWDSSNYALPSLDPNVEIVRVTGISGDTLTITRAQENTSASTKNTAGATYRMILSPTKKMIDDIQTEINNSGGRPTFGGDGSDGSLDTSGGTVDIDLGGARVVEKNYTSINIVTNNLTFSNPHDEGTVVILKSQGDVNIASTIDLTDLGAVGGAATSSGSNDGTQAFPLKTDIRHRGIGGINSGGEKQGYKYEHRLITDGSSLPLGLYISPGSGGGGGRGESTGNSGAGGRGGGAMYIECGGQLDLTGTINANGQDGGNADNSENGGGGGGAGGQVLIVADIISTTSGTVDTSGGAGGSGGNGTGGADGGGGAGSHYADGGNGGRQAAGSDAAGKSAGGGGGGTGSSAGGAGGASAGAIIYDKAELNF